MAHIPEVISKVVNQDLCIGCGLCVYKCPSGALKMNWNELGFLTPQLTNECNNNGDCITVCPFNPEPENEVKTENELAEKFLIDAILHHPKIGKYYGIYAGYAHEYRLTSSSGGLATFVSSELLEKGYINHVISVKESHKPGQYYEYSISNSKDELLAFSKTRYFPVTLGTILPEVHKLKGKIAIVGVGCFIKAIRLAQHRDPELNEKIPFLIGIICGGLKSRFYTEYLSAKAGATKKILQPQYRIKNIESSAGDYSFGCIEQETNSEKTIRMKQAGDMWGTGLFKSNACDFCEDVTTELADISLGDAWINPYHLDGKGTNLIVTRTVLAEKLINDGINQKKLSLDHLSLDQFLASQKGSFNHRHTGLSYRIKEAKQNNKNIPPKRFSQEKITFDFAIVQWLRRKIRQKSLITWLKTRDATNFDTDMKAHLKMLKIATAFYHFKKSAFKKLHIK